MSHETIRSYSQEEKDQILKECFESNNYGAVSNKNGIPSTTIYGWIKKYKNKDKSKRSKEIKGLALDYAFSPRKVTGSA